MDRRRWILAALALAAALVAAGTTLAVAAGGPRQFRTAKSLNGSGGPAIPGPLALTRVTVGQLGNQVTFGLRTAKPWSAAQLAADPRRTLCLYISRSSAGGPPSRRVCITATRHASQLALRFDTLSQTGAVTAKHALAGTVTRSDSRSAETSFDPTTIGLLPGRKFYWRAGTTWVDRTAACTPAPAGMLPCTDSAPRGSAQAAKLYPVKPIGCSRPRQEFVTGGPTRAKVVALSFDDGPSTYTPLILDSLERNHVHATFFTIGRQVAPLAGLLRRELSDGDIVGDHTWSHPNVAGGGAFAESQLGMAKAAIERATGFTPCLFRAPYGAVSNALFGVATGLGLTTIQWNVDPRDWSLPGTAAIVSRVTEAVRPGSIVIMHDGGGPRGETAAAVPQIIHTLQARGYSFATIPELLGQTVLYGRR